MVLGSCPGPWLVWAAGLRQDRDRAQGGHLSPEAAKEVLGRETSQDMQNPWGS